MAAIPLEKTIESTYRFAFTNFLSVFGIVWLPSLVFLGVLGPVAWFVWPDIQGLHALNSAGWNDSDFSLSDEDRGRLLRVFLDFGRFAGLIALVGLVARAMIAVGVLEKALGRRQGPVFVYFSLGAPVWRMIGALLLAGIVIACVVFATCVAVLAVVWAVVHYAAGISGLAKFASIAAAVSWIVYMALRLVFFLPAVVVAEGRIGIARAWALGARNFWRIVALMLAVLLPVAIAAGIVSHALFGGMWIMELQMATAAKHALSPAEMLGAVMTELRGLWPVFLAFNLVYFTLLTGLGLGAMANAYKAVTAPEAGA